MDDPKIGATYRDWQAIADRRLELLREIEWARIRNAGGFCHFCGRQMIQGHADDCRLAKELSDAPMGS